MERTKKQIENYIKQRGKDRFAGTYDRWGKTWVYFQNKETGLFTGIIEKNKYSENATKKYAGMKVKITVRFPNKRGKKSYTYKVYNRRQQKEIIYRMNRRNRTPEFRNNFRNYFEPKRYENDAIPQSAQKKKIDMLFDDVVYEDALIEYYQGYG